ncbi:MAG: DUF4349 domain-containing protein [Gaiellales bacterium]|nr:MAG: DUF4349 domain-containing protein [Gaiellales bacterium]
MTEMNEQELNRLLDMIAAGEEPDAGAVTDERIAALVELAISLRRGRPEPSEEFVRAMDEKLERDAQGGASRVRQDQPGRASLLPDWLSWRRAAAVAAALVVGLGLLGMTRAIMSGGPLDSKEEIAVTDTEGRGAAQEKNTAGELYGTEEMDSAAPVDMDAESAGLAATEALPGGQLSAPELRRVIQSAAYEIEVPTGDFQDRYGEVAGIAARYGGYVVSSDSSVSGPDDAQLKQGVITIRVANVGDNFTRAQEDIESLGTVVARQVSGEDVTQEFVDLQSRLRNAEAQQASLLTLMQKAQTIEEILQVQARLYEVQMEIEQLKGSIEYMESMTDYASLTVEVREEDVEKPEEEDGAGIEWGFVEAIRHAGWLAVQTVNFVIIALGVLIPALAIAALAALAAWRLYRWRRGS